MFDREMDLEEQTGRNPMNEEVEKENLSLEDI
jgi:hypothetical protein